MLDESMYKASEIKFPKLPGNCPMKIDDNASISRHEDGYSNPNLIRIDNHTPIEFDITDERQGTEVEFNPYENTPQPELLPREYNFYISDVNSYRQVTYFNHDEESEFWEVP